MQADKASMRVAAGPGRHGHVSGCTLGVGLDPRIEPLRAFGAEVDSDPTPVP